MKFDRTADGRNKGAIATLIFHGIVLLLLLLFKFSLPLLQGGGDGILINFGNSVTGLGNAPLRSEPAEPVPARPVPAEPQAQPERQEREALLTQDMEEAPAVKSEPKPVVKATPVKTPVVKPVVKQPVAETKTDPKSVTSEPATQPKPVERTPNQQALFPGRKVDGSTNQSEGTAGGAGDQGKISGDALSGSNLGEGSGGSGGGTGGGVGPGRGIDFSLTGRSAEALPAPDYPGNIEGVVVVEVTVDKDGRVTAARPGVRGSTTNDSRLLNAARTAAMASRFSRQPDAPVQRGTITYRFKLQ